MFAESDFREEYGVVAPLYQGFQGLELEQRPDDFPRDDYVVQGSVRSEIAEKARVRAKSQPVS